MPKPEAFKPRYLLLDTHVWIWLINGSPEIDHKQYLNTVQQYARKDAVRISAISIWELAMLVSKKRLSLSKDVSLWVKESLKVNGLAVEALSTDILLESAQMDDSAHGDPADRMILVTAKHIKAAIMTADGQMIEYCKHHGLPVEPIKK